MKIFLSYARADGQYIANRLYADLKAQGQEPWVDRISGLQPGDRFDEKIQTAIDCCDLFLFLLTPAAVRAGGFCRQELTYALQTDKPVIPLMVADCVPPIQITTYNWLDLRTDYGQGISILLDAIRNDNLDMALFPPSSLAVDFQNFRIDGDDVAVFYRQPRPQGSQRKAPPRIVGDGGLLYGRAMLFSNCVDTLRSQSPDTIVLQGMGGVGKSSLAAGLAWGMAGYFAGGTVWLDAQNATLMDLCDQLGRVYEDEQMPRLTVQEKPIHAHNLISRETTLVVLDNADSREIVSSFKERCNPSNLIVTTRTRLARLGRLIEVNTLSMEPASALFRAIAHLEANQYTPYVHELVQLLGGHPQALAIAAALCLEDELTPEEVIAMLKPAASRIALLQLSPDTRDNVWATFDTSYQGLTTQEKVVFRGLGGSWSRTVTEDILLSAVGLAREELASALRGLVRRALVSLSTRTASEIRSYRVHELIHAYAQALVQQQDGSLIPLQTRWLTSAVTYAHNHARDDSMSDYDHLEVEIENLLGAADWAFEHKELRATDEIALSLCARSDMMSKRGFSAESVPLLEHAIAAARTLANREHVGLHLGMLGSTYVDLSDFTEAIKLLEQAVKISMDVGDAIRACQWTGMIGNAYGDMGIGNKAIEYLSRAITIARDLQDPVAEGFWLGWRGNAYRDKGDYESAQKDLLAAISVLESANHLLGTTMWRGNYARLLVRMGEPAKGLTFCEHNPTIADQLGNPRLKSWALLFLSECLHGIGRAEEAYSKAFEGAELMRKIGDRDGLAEILHNLGQWYLEDRDYVSAQVYIDEALVLRRAMSHGDLGKTEALLKHLNNSRTKPRWRRRRT